MRPVEVCGKCLQAQSCLLAAPPHLVASAARIGRARGLRSWLAITCKAPHGRRRRCCWCCGAKRGKACRARSNLSRLEAWEAQHKTLISAQKGIGSQNRCVTGELVCCGCGNRRSLSSAKHRAAWGLQSGIAFVDSSFASSSSSPFSPHRNRRFAPKRSAGIITNQHPSKCRPRYASPEAPRGAVRHADGE